MEGDDNSNIVPQMGSAAEPQVLPVSEGMEVAGGLQEKLNYVGGDDGHGGVAVGASGGGGQFSGKRKRGRPRKQPVQTAVELQREFIVAPESLASPQKRGRGRPKGSGKWQTLAANLGESAAESAGSNFTPHTIAIQPGENIVQTICSFSQRASESICILSASGTVSSAEILRPGSCGGILRYEGRFEIVSLTGSHSNNAASDGHGKICLLSVQLANPDGGLFGGAVAGSLIAGGPTQLVIATFRQKFREQPKVRHHIEPSKPNQAAVAVPLQTANGTFSDSEMNSLSLSTAPPLPAPPVDGMDKAMNGPDVNHASPQPFDWNSLQSSAHMSQHVISSDVNTGAAD
ncbi:AT-hook motif nuclear-localized protein 1 [Sesamum alatum]|uniref:AT-hook motif nuclear-localized protein n=1 Tax=Sesamum alatum TaxID=300844 RepID=A0AAE1Z2V7_9LAMI|nr:AT-hook motif nuclear-localized protein 1 [Sesamum alatum]